MKLPIWVRIPMALEVVKNQILAQGHRKISLTLKGEIYILALKDEAIELQLEETFLDELGVNYLVDDDVASHTTTEGASWAYLDLENRPEETRT
jgi:hypothetical protein